MGAAVALVVFDIAGTTVIDNGEIAQSFQKAMQAFGYQVPVERINPLMGYEKGEAIRSLLQEHEVESNAITPEHVRNIHKRFLQEMIRYYQTTSELTPLPGAEETFQQLRQRGIKTALNTGFSKDITDVILQRLAWVPEKVDFVISSSEVARGRPFPFMIEALMQRAGVPDAKQVVKVGDTEVDVREGQNAGCLYSIGVTTGAFTRDALQPYQPSFIIDTLTELLPIIDNAGGTI
jgi:phosphonatase-like hydrolase